MRFFLILGCLLALSVPSLAAEKSAYQRVMDSGTIRCGWGTASPWISKDLDSGAMKGLNAELVEALARELNLKLEWPEETGWGEMPTALYAGRVDVACSLLWNEPLRGKQVAFTRPLFYNVLHAWAREDDTRFTGRREELNDPAVRIIGIDGDMSAALTQRLFPKAQMISLPANISTTDMYMNLTTGKADVVFLDPTQVADFNANSEKKLRRIPLEKPIAVYGTALAVSIHETALKEMLDTAVTYMLQSGKIDDLTAEFRARNPGAILLPATPYEEMAP